MLEVGRPRLLQPGRSRISRADENRQVRLHAELRQQMVVGNHRRLSCDAVRYSLALVLILRGYTPMMKLSIAFALIFAALCAPAAAQSGSPVPANEEIRKILAQRIDDAKQSIGIVVGVIE